MTIANEKYQKFESVIFALGFFHEGCCMHFGGLGLEWIEDVSFK